MTNEEAIYHLRNTGWLAPSLEPIDEAIEMACEALRKTEPTISKIEQVDKDINVRSKDEPQTKPLQTCSVNGRPYSECASCEHFRCTADEPQTDCPWK